MARKLLVPCALVLAAALITASYRPALQGSWLLWDDASYVYRNRLVVQLRWPQKLRAAFTSFQCSNYHPLTMLSHAAVWHIAGPEATAHRAVNLVLHLLNALLVYVLIRRLNGSRPIALAAALLFGLHPMNVSVVAWVAERKELLATGFVLLAVLGWLAVARRRHPYHAAAAYVLVLAAATAALLSKPTAVTLPALLLAATLTVTRTSRTPHTWLVLTILTFGAGALATLTWLAQRTTAIHDFPWFSRLCLMAHTLAWYFWHAVAPLGLSPHHPRYPHWMLPDAHVAAGVALLGAAVGIAVWSRRRVPAVAFGLVWFLLCWLPVSGAVPVGQAAVAERYLYLSQVGLLIAGFGAARSLATVATEAAAPVRWSLSAVGLSGVIAVLSWWALETQRYARVWANEERLWKAVLHRYRDSGLAWVNLGAYYAQVKGDRDAAAACLAAAVATKTDGQQKLAGMNLLLLRLQDQPEDPGLLWELERLLDEPPKRDNRLVRKAIVRARAVAARAALSRRHPQAALRHAERGLRFGPDDPELLYLAGASLSALGRAEEASQQFTQLLNGSNVPAKLRQAARQQLASLRRTLR